MINKIVTISDTHLQHEKHKINIPSGDILIHAGDATWTGRPEEIEVFSKWFHSFPHKYKVFIAGNHDILFEKNEEAALTCYRQYANETSYYLNDSFVVINGIKIYGSPYQPEFGYDWAFNRRRGQDIEHIWKNIPSDTNILVTHGPAYGYGDSIPHVILGDERIDKVGCFDLLRHVKRVKPRYHIFGHIHSGYGVFKDNEFDITYINCSICDEEYVAWHDPIVFDYEIPVT